MADLVPAVERPAALPRSDASGAATPAFSASQRRLPILLRRAWYGLNQAFRRRIAHTGLTPDQYTVLRNLAEGDIRGITQRELTRNMSSDPNTITALVDRMEALGLVERRAHESDGRARRIVLLPSSRELLNQVREIAEHLQGQALNALPEAHRNTFLRDLAIVAEACRAAAETSPRGNGNGADKPAEGV